jgi:hypothetical protein
VAPDSDLTPSEEVAEAFWVPWSLISDSTIVRESPVSVRGAVWQVPSYVLGSRVVWGMTERILSDLVARMRVSG